TEFVVKGDTISWQQVSTRHPYYKKFRIQSGDQATYMSNNPVIMIRYAHVLLIYAEAQARATGTPSSEAYLAVNAVRNRAGLTGLLPGLSAADFAAAVVAERGWEFAGEWNRWFDLVRLEMVESANAGKHPDDLKPSGAITHDKYHMPIPGNDALINPNL
ncbi:MAG TPA: RagB/SusD family nutrient uptake outer membrane protein, partial [Chitinophaga sp.]